MTQPVDDASDLTPFDDDDRLGEAIELYLELIERGEAPAAETFAARYGELEADVRAALEGLELVHGLVGGGSGSAVSGDSGPGRNIESGRRIAGYRVVRELGRGGMGTVYEAVHVGLDRPVALKVLGTHAAPDSSARRRFLNEARTAAGLHHTHIVPVFDVGQVGGLCYYAMQRIEGSGLDSVVRWLRRERGSGAGRWSETGGRNSSSSATKFLRAWSRASSGLPWTRRSPAPGPRSQIADDPTPTWSHGHSLSRLSRSGAATAATALAVARPREDESAPPFEPPRGSSYYRWAARVGREAAEALDHAHQHGVIHRDVKPSNLLIDAAGSIWVADFGLARRLADPGLTHHDGILGTPRYMSPEQGRTGVIDGRTDVYSLGATLYELLTLRPPFDGSSAAELLDQIAGREPAPPRAIDPRIPRDLETIVLKSLAKRPADRYATAADLAADLARFLNREPVKARRISLPGRAWRVLRRHPGISSVTAAASLIILAVAAFAYHRVVKERDLAEQERDLKVEALHKADAALAKTEEAMRDTQAALRTGLWRHAELVRRTDAPDRRGLGLDLLKQSAALEPDPAMKARLRDEAAEFLVLRDIEPRVDLATGPTRDVVLGAAGSRLTALTASIDGEELAFWDVACRRRGDAVALRKLAKVDPRDEPSPTGGRGAGGGGAPPPPRRGVWWWGDRLAPCGSNLAVVPEGGESILLVDAATGGLVRELDRGAGRVVGVFGEPTGKRLAAVEVEAEPREGPPTPPSFDNSGSRRDYRVVLWDLELSEPHARVLDLDLEGRYPMPPMVAVSADGKTLAVTASGATTIRLLSTEDGGEIRAIEAPADVRALALGGRDLLAAASEGTIQLWNLANPDAAGFVTSLSSSQSPVVRLQFNPQGTLLAAASFVGPQVELWDALTHKLVAVLSAADPVADLAFSADGRTLAVGGKNLTTSSWTIHEPAVRTLVGGLDSRPSSIAFRDDGLLAIADLAGDLWLWSEPRGASETAVAAYRLSAAQAETIARKDVVGPPVAAVVGALARAGEGRALVLARGGSLYLWETDRPDRLLPLARVDEPLIGPAPPRASGPSDDARRRGPAHRPGGGPPPPHDERRRSPGPPELPPWGSPWGRLRSFQIAPASDRLYLVLGTPSSVQAWSLRRAEDRVEATVESWVDAPPANPSAIALSPDGGLLAISDGAGSIVLMDALRLTLVGRIAPRPDEPEAVATALAFSPDGRRLAAGSQQGVQFWDLDVPSSPRPSYRLPGPNGRTFALDFRPDGRRLAVLSSDAGVEFWDLDALEDGLRRLDLGD